MLFVRTREGKDRLAGHLDEGNRAKTLSAPAVAILAYDVAFHEQMPVVFPARGAALRAAFAGRTERRERLAAHNSAPQTGMFLLRCARQGSRPVPWRASTGPVGVRSSSPVPAGVRIWWST
ncbi:hypothetical protein ABZ357_19095 [Streptomyces sp. NPDC005917]|uniref:hypothetical protein n=1 Tax=unclassified Streptomyces TaxID=2593676 RepID=UPI0033DDF374